MISRKKKLREISQVITVTIILLLVNIAYVYSSETSKGSNECKALASITNIIISPDDRTVLTNWNNTEMRLWDMETGKLVRDFLPDNSSAMFAHGAISPQNNIVAIGTEDGTTLWDILTGTKLQFIPREIKDTFGTDVSFSSDGLWLFTSGYDGASLWDVKTGKNLYTFPGQQARDASQHGHLSPDNKYVLTTNKFQVDIWSTSTGKKLKTFDRNLYGMFTPDAAGIFTWRRNATSGDGELVLWDTATFQEKRVFPISPSILKFSPDSKYFLESGNPVKLWEIATGRALLDIRYGFIIGFFPNNHILLPYSDPNTSSGKENTLQIWDPNSQQTIQQIPIQENTIFNYQITHDGNYLVFTNNSGEIYLWSIQKNAQVFQFC